MHDTYLPPYIWMLFWEIWFAAAHSTQLSWLGQKKGPEMAVYMFVSRGLEASTAFIESSSVK